MPDACQPTVVLRGDIMPRTRVSPRMRRTRRQPIINTPQIGTTIWNAAIPFVQPLWQRGELIIAHFLTWLIAHPMRWRVAIGGLLVIVFGWSAWSLIGLPESSSTQQMQPVVAVAPPAASGVPATPVAALSDADTVLVVISAYNQASIAAGQTMRADLLQPYLAPEGRAWSQASTEFARRVRRGETADAELVRWGVVESTISNEQATMTTREVWNVITAVGGTIISSRRGTMTETTYTLRRDDYGSGWMITDVTTTVLIA